MKLQASSKKKTSNVAQEFERRKVSKNTSRTLQKPGSRGWIIHFSERVADLMETNKLQEDDLRQCFKRVTVIWGFY